MMTIQCFTLLSLARVVAAIPWYDDILVVSSAHMGSVTRE